MYIIISNLPSMDKSMMSVDDRWRVSTNYWRWVVANNRSSVVADYGCYDMGWSMDYGARLMGHGMRNTFDNHRSRIMANNWSCISQRCYVAWASSSYSNQSEKGHLEFSFQIYFSYTFHVIHNKYETIQLISDT